MCLSFRTPPVVRPQAILIGKMIPEWVKQGINPIIVTYETSDQWQIDLPIYYIPQLKISRYFNKIGFDKNLIEKRYYQKIFKLVKSLIIKHKIELVFSFFQCSPISFANFLSSFVYNIPIIFIVPISFAYVAS